MIKLSPSILAANFANLGEDVKKAEEILANDRYDEIAGIAREHVIGNDWEAITDKFENAMNDLL